MGERGRRVSVCLRFGVCSVHPALGQHDGNDVEGVHADTHGRTHTHTKSIFSPIFHHQAHTHAHMTFRGTHTRAHIHCRESACCVMHAVAATLARRTIHTETHAPTHVFLMPTHACTNCHTHTHTHTLRSVRMLRPMRDARGGPRPAAPTGSEATSGAPHRR